PGPGLVDGQGPAPDLLAVERRDGLVPTAGHLDEPEAAGPAGLAVGCHLGPDDLAVRLEQRAEVVRRRLEGQVADVDVLGHVPPRARGPVDGKSNRQPGGRGREAGQFGADPPGVFPAGARPPRAWVLSTPGPRTRPDFPRSREAPWPGLSERWGQSGLPSGQLRWLGMEGRCHLSRAGEVMGWAPRDLPVTLPPEVASGRKISEALVWAG